LCTLARVVHASVKVYNTRTEKKKMYVDTGERRKGERGEREEEYLQIRTANFELWR
jgi:hypothetical protein